MKKFIPVLFVIIFGLISCEKEQPLPTLPEERQTVFIYMPWSDNLTDAFRKNIADFESAIAKGILKNERVVVFFSSSLTEATLFELEYKKGENVQTLLKEYTNPAFTTAGGITSILNDVKKFAPADKYAMIIGCHGMGWLPVSALSRSIAADEKFHWEYEGVPLTRFFGGLSSISRTDVTTLAEGIKNAGVKMEYILFDDCYMSSIEVAYDLKEATNYLIACPTEIMAHGMPYATIAEHLVGTVDYKSVCDEFLAFYESYSTPCGTIGITNCGELDNLVPIMKEINSRFTFDSSLLSSLQRLDGYTPVIFYDYGDYVSKLCTDAALLKEFENQLERVIPSQYRLHTATYYTMILGREVDINTYSGITTSDPSTNSRAATKTETAWYKATH